MKVKNLNGTSENNATPLCKCNSWIDHYEQNYGKEVRNDACCVSGCNNTGDLVGAHVKKVDSNSHYIAPICKSCNNKRGKELEISTDYRPLIPVKSKGCQN